MRSWKVPGDFISLPGSSREVVGGFGEVLVRVYEIQEVSRRGWRAGGPHGRAPVSGPLRGRKVSKGGTGGRRGK